MRTGWWGGMWWEKAREMAEEVSVQHVCWAKRHMVIHSPQIYWASTPAEHWAVPARTYQLGLCFFSYGVQCLSSRTTQRTVSETFSWAPSYLSHENLSRMPVNPYFKIILLDEHDWRLDLAADLHDASRVHCILRMGGEHIASSENMEEGLYRNTGE